MNQSSSASFIRESQQPDLDRFGKVIVPLAFATALLVGFCIKEHVDESRASLRAVIPEDAPVRHRHVEIDLEPAISRDDIM